jgi:hypothetical protein
MDKLIDARFERVEKALQTLITSIATYNPTPAHATDLLTADNELNKGLEQCTRPASLTKTMLTISVSLHQRNHEKILSLRSTSSTLDNQIRETLTLLTDTRRALINTSSTVFPQTTNPVTYSELLSYAKKISDKTLPSTYREKSEAADGGIFSPTKDKSEPHTNGNTTPVGATNSSNGITEDGHLGMSNNGTAMEIDSATPSNAGGVTHGQTSQESSNSNTALPLDWQQHLNPLSQIPFLPWPADHDIKRGALATIQVLLDRGEDPATFDPERGAELEEQRKRIVEEEERVQAEERARLEDERRREMERRMSASGNARGEGKEERPKVFQLETFDDDDDSE